jgi:hypothetical protein
MSWTMSCIVIVADEGAMAATISSTVIDVVDDEAASLLPGTWLAVLGRWSEFRICAAGTLAERWYCMRTSRTTCATDIRPICC